MRPWQSKAVAAIITVGVVLNAWCVWPTQWVYGGFPGLPKCSFRVHRITGEEQIKVDGEWRAFGGLCGMGR